MDPTRLLFPALRWKDDTFVPEEAPAAELARRGVGGFIVFGGPADEVRATTRRLQREAPHHLVFGADLERGAGQQFHGATSLPPLAALASLRDPLALWRAGYLTAREARALGVDWIYAPVADLANEPDNPIVGTRSPGSDPEWVARAVTVWSLGCAAAGGLACAKHFPGHGRTRTDSHLELPEVEAGLDDLARDVMPFAAAVEAGVPSIMMAHVSYPALDPAALPASRSRRIVTDLLRGRVGFRGVVVTDALVMSGFAAHGEASAAVESVAAGVDALLYPEDPAAVEAAVRAALESGRLSRTRVRQAIGRVSSLADRASAAPEPESFASGPGEPAWGVREDRVWARAVAERSMRWMVQPPETRPPTRVVLHTVDDDVGGPYPPPERSVLPESLREWGVEVVEAGEGETPAADGGSVLVAVYGEVRGWKGRAGLSEEARLRVRELARKEKGVVVLFGHPRLAAAFPQDRPVLCAWGGEAIMQEAAARVIARRLVGERVPAPGASPGSS